MARLSEEELTISVVLRVADSIHSVNRYELRTIAPIPKREAVRPFGFIFGICLGICGLWLAIAWFLSGGFKAFRGEAAFPVTMIAVAVVGIFWALSSLRRWHYARFYSECGELRFTLRCTDRDPSRFERFIDSVVEQIRRVKNEA